MKLTTRTFCMAMAAWLLAPACVTVKPVVLDRKTQLENQVLGAFTRLEQDLVLASSVRGSDARAPGGGLAGLRREAAEAMLLREFIRDDVEALKQDKAAGEGKAGKLVLLSPPEDEARAARARRLVKQENDARATIISCVLQLDPKLSDRDRPLVTRIFQRLNREAARPGDLVQLDDGRWVEVKPR